MKSITLIQPDDWHVHLRDGETLGTVARHTAERFGRALVMPNLMPPVTTVDEALAYRARITRAVPEALGFQPYMALYLTPQTGAAEVARCAEEAHVLGFKLYPAGATTHSDAGIVHLEKVYPILEAMERHGVPLMVHGEVTDTEVDIFDREKAFIDDHLAPITARFPALKVTFEHITTQDAVEFVRSSGPHVAATITAHHLLYNRNALLVGGIHPHYYCLPVLKREAHRQALIEAACSGEAQFFLGTDSAPHDRSRKESLCGCAGCYTAYAAIELYATAFEQAGALHRLEQFASISGARFYGLPPNERSVTLCREPHVTPESFAWGSGELIPLTAGATISWRLREPAIMST
jgi:dihydroorotase